MVLQRVILPLGLTYLETTYIFGAVWVKGVFVADKDIVNEGVPLVEGWIPLSRGHISHDAVVFKVAIFGIVAVGKSDVTRDV